MKTRESGMPAEDLWKSFFHPDEILSELGLKQSCNSVVDFGSGYGTFTIPAAQRIAGTVFAFEIDPDMVNACRKKLADTGIQNVVCQHRDFVTEGTGLPDETIEYAMMFNILHAENPVDLLREAYRILVPGGNLAAIHWNYDPSTPRGPSMEIRPQPEQMQLWIQAAGFHLSLPWVNLPPFHYGMLGRKPV